METPAPIAVFAYKRPRHLAQTLDALSKCALAGKSELYIFCDGARKDSDRDAVEETRALARAQAWCKELHVVERTENLGLSKSITSGVGMLCEKYGRVIVLEDDLVVSPGFLEFMNAALDRYASDERVMQISGYMYPTEAKVAHDAFFAVHSSCWGWATWQRAWKEYGTDPALIERLRTDRALRRKFDLGDSYPYYKMLAKQVTGEIDSWGVLWYLTLFRKQGLVLMPRKSLVRNAGQDGSGENTDTLVFNDRLADFAVKAFPPVEQSAEGERAIQRYLFRSCVPWYRRIFRSDYYR